MGFIDTYKHLEKLCGEVTGDDRRLSAYIDEMLDTPDGKYCVHNWDEDLKTLKHYRWVRNQIAHEPDCNEANMCDPEDELWLRHFYSRIMKQTDPLSLYHKAHYTTKTSRTEAFYDEDESYSYVQKKKRGNAGTFFVVAIFIIVLLLLYQYFLYML